MAATVLGRACRRFQSDLPAETGGKYERVPLPFTHMAVAMSRDNSVEWFMQQYSSAATKANFFIVMLFGIGFTASHFCSLQTAA